MTYYDYYAMQIIDAAAPIAVGIVVIGAIVVLLYIVLFILGSRANPG